MTLLRLTDEIMKLVDLHRMGSDGMKQNNSG